jgi:long-chain acyl-CoA synthetase
MTLPAGGTPSDVWRLFQNTTVELRDRAAIASGYPELSVSFRQLEREALNRTVDIEGFGVGEGDLVAVASRDAVAFTTLVLATLRLSASALLLAPTHGRQVIRAVAHEVGADWFLTDDAGLAGEIAATLGGTRVEQRGSSFGIAGRADRKRPSRAESLAIVKLSSGSSAKPKAIGLSAAAILAEAAAVSSTLALRGGRAALCPVPLHHSYGFDLGILPMLTAGSTLVVHSPLVPGRLVDRLQGRDVSVLLGVPALYGVLVETPLRVVPKLEHVDHLLSCTAPLSPRLIERFHQRFDSPICQHYGASEVGGVTTHLPAAVMSRPESVGRPMPGVGVEIVDGEVVVSGPALASGYLMGAPAHDSPFRNERFHMGDTGSLDAQGFLTIGGRRDAIINVGGLKVSPEEVQFVLEDHPAVRGAIVSGRERSSGDRYVHAVVAVSADVTERDLIAHCRLELEDFKVPRRIEIRDQLPRLPSGKVDVRAGTTTT